jgi:hypothetical protein
MVITAKKIKIPPPEFRSTQFAFSCAAPERVTLRSPTLSSQSHTDVGERTVETAVLTFRRVDTAVHRAKEEIGAIAERDFEVVDAEREANRPTYVRHYNRALAGKSWRGVSVASIGRYAKSRELFAAWAGMINAILKRSWA